MGKNGVKSIPQKANKASTVKPAATKKIAHNKKRNISKNVESDSDVSSDEKKNGNKKVKTNDSDSSDSDSESESSSVDGFLKKETSYTMPKFLTGANKKSSEEDSSEDSSEEDSSEEDSSSDSDAKATTKIQNKESSIESSSDSTSDSSESDSSSNDKEKKAVKTTNGSTFALSKDSSSTDGDSSESDSSSNDKKNIAKAKNESTFALSKDSSSADDSSSSSNSESEEDESESENKQEKPIVSAQQNGAKRKQDEQKFSSLKKTKINDNNSSTCTVFVGNLSYDMDEDRLAQEFEEAGEITDVRIIYDNYTGKSKGFGYVEFTNSESAQKALSFSGKDVDGRTIKVDLADQKPKNGGGNANNNKNRFQKDLSEPSDTLFIGNLSFTADEDTLRKTFEKYGQINSIRLPTFPDTGGRKAFGYLTFNNVASAQEAMELQGTRIDGRAVRLDFAAPPQQSFESNSPRKDGYSFGRGGVSFGRGGRGGGGRGGRGGGRGNRGGNRGGYRGGGHGDSNRGGSPGRVAANKGTIVPGSGQKNCF